MGSCTIENVWWTDVCEGKRVLRLPIDLVVNGCLMTSGLEQTL
jgi:hypothetical protein